MAGRQWYRRHQGRSGGALPLRRVCALLLAGLCALLVARSSGALPTAAPPAQHELLPAQARWAPALLAEDNMVIEELPLAFPRLPRQFDGLTVAVIADLHAGRGHGTRAYVERLVRVVNGLRPEAILLLGDQVHRAAAAPHFLPLLGQLRAPEGVWACLGNHEHEYMWYSPWLRREPTYGVEQWREWYRAVGAQLLANEARALTRDGARLWLAGVDDAYTGRHNLPATLAQTQPGEFHLMLSHSPDLLDDPRVGEVDLILAGHTHGGQVWIPGVGPFAAPCRKPAQRAAGLVRDNGTTMYVSRGAGEGLRLRLGCPREITLLTLRAG